MQNTILANHDPKPLHCPPVVAMSILLDPPSAKASEDRDKRRLHTMTECLGFSLPWTSSDAATGRHGLSRRIQFLIENWQTPDNDMLLCNSMQGSLWVTTTLIRGCLSGNGFGYYLVSSSMSLWQTNLFITIKRYTQWPKQRPDNNRIVFLIFVSCMFQCQGHIYFFPHLFNVFAEDSHSWRSSWGRASWNRGGRTCFCTFLIRRFTSH